MSRVLLSLREKLNTFAGKPEKNTLDKQDKAFLLSSMYITQINFGTTQANAAYLKKYTTILHV